MKLYKTENGFISLENVRKVEKHIDNPSKHTTYGKAYYSYKGYVQIYYENGTAENINIVQMDGKDIFNETLYQQAISNKLDETINEIYNILSQE